MKLLTKLKNSSLRNKILSTYIIFLVLIVVILLILYIQSVSSTQDYTISYINQINSQMNQNVDTILISMERLNYLQFFDDETRLILKKKSSSLTPQERMENELYMKNTLNHLFRMNEFIVRGSLLSRHGDVYSNISTDMSWYVSYIQSLDEEIDWSHKNNVYYTGIYDTTVNRQTYQVITLVRKLYYYDSDIPLATLAIDFDYKKIQKIFDNYYAQNSMSSIAVFNNELPIYTSPNSRLDFEGELVGEERESLLKQISDEIIEKKADFAEIEVGGKQYLFTAQRNRKTGWVIVQYMLMSELRASAVQGIQRVLIMLICVWVGVVVLSFFISRQISKPLEMLDSTLQKTGKGKVELMPLPEDLSDDEVGRLMRNYNTMAERINDNIEKTYIYELNQRRTQLKMLQFQINPHFMYNTLNTISAIAEISNVPEIVSVSDSLSRMLRYNIKGSDIVRIKDEIEHIENYLKIQSVRFPEKFQVELEISPELSCCYMLKFLLQPVLENVISHGFAERKKDGQIRIQAVLEGEEIVITVWDNGAGIALEKLERLNHLLSAPESGALSEIELDDGDTSIGLANVAARIKNYYGSGYGLLLESEEGVYTRAILRLKAKYSSEK